MKALKIIGHPILIISMFLLVLISGEAFGGPYLLYLLLGLPHGVNYAVVGVLGLVCLFISYKIYRGEKKHWIKPGSALLGILLMLYSLYIFFANDKMRYNYSTFEQSVPIISLVLFALSVICGIILNLIQILKFLRSDTDPPVDSLTSI